MKHLLLAIIAYSFVGPAYAADQTSDADRQFVAMVSQGGSFEVQVGTLAASYGSTQDIKDQGVTETHDHQLVNAKLSSMAPAAGIRIDPKLNPEFQKELDDLKALKGTDFDKAYLKDMEDIHAKDGAAFAEEAKNGTNPSLKSFAAETYRIVERHIGELKAVGPE